MIVVGAGGTAGYWATLNAFGPSTEYHEPTIIGAKALPDGKFEATVGDRNVYVTYSIIRHKLNGDCFLKVWRYGEEIGGPRDGTRHLFDQADLRFVGANEMRHPRWPSTHGLDLKDDLIPPELQEQELALYNVARYYCNPLDYVFGRYLQGGIKPDETERVTLVLKRKQP